MSGKSILAGLASREELAEVAAQIARGLSKADLVQGRAYIRTSVLLPSGSTVVVVVEDQNNGRYRLSDIAQGFEEADRQGFARTYRAQAKEVAALSGITFDGSAFVFADATNRQLVGIVMAVANAVSRTAERTLLRAAQRPKDGAVERLVARLTKLFPDGKVERDVELRGASEHPWHVNAMLSAQGRRAVFDIVTPHPTSIAFASTMFHDLALLDEAPLRVAVVHKKAAFNELLAVVAQAAYVVEDEAPDRAFMRISEKMVA